MRRALVFPGGDGLYYRQRAWAGTGVWMQASANRLFEEVGPAGRYRPVSGVRACFRWPKCSMTIWRWFEWDERPGPEPVSNATRPRTRHPDSLRGGETEGLNPHTHGPDRYRPFPRTWNMDIARPQSQFLINEKMTMPADAVAITGGSISVCSLTAQLNSDAPSSLIGSFPPSMRKKRDRLRCPQQVLTR
jgi:hypothetical protein